MGASEFRFFTFRIEKFDGILPIQKSTDSDIPCVKPSSTEEKPDGRIDCSVAYGLCHDAFSVSHRVCRAEPQLFGDIRKGDMLYHTTLLHGFCREGRLEEELSVDFVDKGE
ncbi:hypothetical protein F2Q69_00060185 [Brassica cretica]|uniref:Uncharacterized protein n=1 Tax=Brassica cretica TaxID=69181 RepID=A0A8S9RNU2_BRACR|nr:hypothetical protein F2Q69_00060185 [Brassica cretica]